VASAWGASWGAAWGASFGAEQQAVVLNVGAGGSWEDEVLARHRKQLKAKIAKAVREEQKLVKQEQKILRTVEAERRQDKPVEGILAKYHLITQKIEAKRGEILRLDVELVKLEFVDDDEDIELLMMNL